MWTHNKVTKQAGIKIDYRTCYWFHLFGTPLLLASSFLPIFPLFFFFTCFFFPFVFFFFRFCLVQNEKFSTLDGLYRIDSETDGVTLKLEIAYYWILSTSRIFHAKLEWPRPNVSISIFIYTSALFPWPSLLSFSLFSLSLSSLPSVSKLCPGTSERFYFIRMAASRVFCLFTDWNCRVNRKQLYQPRQNTF